MAVSEKFLGFRLLQRILSFWVALGILFYSLSNEKEIILCFIEWVLVWYGFYDETTRPLLVFFGAALFVINLLTSLKTTQNRYDWKAFVLSFWKYPT